MKASISARRLKRYVKRRLWECPWVVRERAPAKSSPTTMPGSFGNGKMSTGNLTA